MSKIVYHREKAQLSCGLIMVLQKSAAIFIYLVCKLLFLQDHIFGILSINGFYF